MLRKSLFCFETTLHYLSSTKINSWTNYSLQALLYWDSILTHRLIQLTLNQTAMEQTGHGRFLKMKPTQIYFLCLTHFLKE